MPTLIAVTLLYSGALACTNKPAPKPTASSSSHSAAPGTTPSSVPSAAPYAGPTGTVRGKVRVVGDEAPVLEKTLRKIPDNCAAARNVFGRAFRKGENGEAADVLVTATGYDGKIPAAQDHVKVTAKDCAWSSRTVGMTFGQRLEVEVLDAKGYVPHLLGAPTPIDTIPLPGGDPAKMKPDKPGRYGLTDQAHDFMYADVFALNYSTFDVTGADGTFEIAGIPVGKVTVNALLPAAMLVGEEQVTIKANETATVDFELKFDIEEYNKARANAPSSGSASTSKATQQTAPASMD